MENTQEQAGETIDASKTALTALSLAEASEAIQSGDVTSTAITKAMLERIQALDSKLNAYITVSGEDALAQARVLDVEQQQGRLRGPLHGIPIALKDNIDTAGIPTTAASNVYRERIPKEDAEVARRLKAAGAVLLGKLNLHEFAAGGTGHVSAFATTRNPWDLERVTGGSSSGSGGAVAASLCYGALGTDTGGSIRIPSSWCGTVGLKPTYGLVSIRGIVPLMASLDHCGPMTRRVKDAAMLLNVLAGYDPQDAASVPHPGEDYVAALDQPVEGFRLGTPMEFYAELDPEVADAMQAAIKLLTTLTAGVTSDENLPPCGDLMPFLAETIAYHEAYLAQTPERYQSDTQQFLAAAALPTAAEYIRTWNRLFALRHSIDAAFKNFDLVVLPTERILPFTIAESEAASARAASTGAMAPEQWITVANTYQFNLYGLPALSLPCGFSKSGLPIGMTIAGPRFSEGRILALGAAYEAATDWHLHKPLL